MNSTSIFDWVHLAAENVWLYGGAFVLVLSILVFVHEWGHYIVARINGVHVESFSIGFGKEIWGFHDKNGTRWKFSIIPLGGYVQMFGDTDPASAGHSDKKQDDDGKVRKLTKKEKEVAFYTKSVGKRFAIVLAGPAINFIFAIILLVGLYMSVGQPVTPPTVAAVIGDSAASKAGFMPHDEVIAIDGESVKRFEDIRHSVMVGLDTSRVFTVRRGNDVIDIEAMPEVKTIEDHFGFKHSRGLLGLLSSGNALQLENIREVNGVAYDDIDSVRAAILSRMGRVTTVVLDRGSEMDVLSIQPMMAYNQDLMDKDAENYNYLVISPGPDEVLVQYGPWAATIQAVKETYTITMSTLEALGQMVTGQRSATELGGIIRIGAIAGDMAKSGVIALITFAALLSINLGLINLFPIPMLDGGHLVFYIVEAVKGSPIPDQVQEYAFRMGLIILVGVMLFANLNDVVQLIL